MGREPASKRRRLVPSTDVDENFGASSHVNNDTINMVASVADFAASSSLTRPISPSAISREKLTVDLTDEDDPVQRQRDGSNVESLRQPADSDIRVIPTPIRLTQVEGLTPAHNIETVSLRDIVGDSLNRE